MTTHTNDELIERIITLIDNMHTRAEIYADGHRYDPDDFNDGDDAYDAHWSDADEQHDIGVAEGIQKGVAWTLLELRQLQEQLHAMKSKV